jgi:hypothetical protein
MRLHALIEGILFLGLGLVGALEGIRLVRKVDPDSIKDVLGPGYYVISLGIILMVIGLAHLGNNWRLPGFERGKATTADGPRTNKAVPLYMTGVFAVYVTLIYLIGYLMSTLIFFFLEFWLAGVRSWRRNLILTAVVTAVFYVIFIQYCNLVFPQGLFIKRFFL